MKFSQPHIYQNDFYCIYIIKMRFLALLIVLLILYIFLRHELYTNRFELGNPGIYPNMFDAAPYGDYPYKDYRYD